MTRELVEVLPSRPDRDEIRRLVEACWREEEAFGVLREELAVVLPKVLAEHGPGPFRWKGLLYHVREKLPREVFGGECEWSYSSISEDDPKEDHPIGAFFETLAERWRHGNDARWALAKAIPGPFVLITDRGAILFKGEGSQMLFPMGNFPTMVGYLDLRT